MAEMEKVSDVNGTIFTSRYSDTTPRNTLIKMIEISNSTADKICRLLEHFKTVTADIPRTNKTDNARREAGNIIKYINKKRNANSKSKQKC